MKSMVMDLDELHALVANARWFAHYFVKSRRRSDGLYNVTTNYPWKQVRRND